MQSRFGRFTRPAALALIALASLPAVAGRNPAPAVIRPTPAASPGISASRGAVSAHVLVISIDGLRPDAIESYDAPVLGKLVREGAVARDARTVSPSITLPSHVSMLTGVAPEVHGVTWNEDRTAERGPVAVATVFELARVAGFTTAAFFSKSKLKHLLRPGSLDHAAGPNDSRNLVATETIGAASRYLANRRPNVLFVHIAEPDYAGHATGWMSETYGSAVRRADGAVGQLLMAAEAAYGNDNYTVIVTADHGGHDRSHGSSLAADMLIPWIAWGAGVAPGVVTAAVKTTDTAATVLWLLGVERPLSWTGRVVATAYTAGAREAAAVAH